jgi:outer membrane protein OmpA-like peptidoglycan-associated protein
MHRLATPVGAPITWKIVVDDQDWPHTDPTSRTVTVPSGFSPVEYGYWNRSSRRSMYQNWRILAHEMCGHARLFAAGTHPTGPPSGHGGRPSHDPTVIIENAISAEHGIPAAELRGLFADPHHGESIARITIAAFPNNSTRIWALPPAEAAKLGVATAFMKKAGVEADIIGHSDQPGSSAVNNRVSRSRAETVKANLIGRGVRAGQFIAVRGVGSTECPAPGPQPSCRKVELIMFVLRGGSLTHP